MEQKKLFNTFLRDGEDFVSEMGEILLKLEKEPSDSELIAQAFRQAHSLKSEASFLKQTDIINLTHEMETVFDKYRNSEETPASESIDHLLLSVDRIKEIIDFLKQRNSDQEEAETEQDSKVPGGIMLDGMPTLTDFEKDLLFEARDRGEKFYRLIFELEDSAPLKYPKAYLLISNLEQKVNVIRTIPSFGEDNDDLYRRMSIYFTCSIRENEIYESVNIDQIESIKLVPLLYESFLGENDTRNMKSAVNSGDMTVKISARKLEQISSYIDEIKIQTYRLKRQQNTNGGRNERDFGTQIDNISELASGLETMIREVSMVTLEDAFRDMNRFVRDLSRKLDKETELEFEGCDIKVERSAGDILAETVIHLVRNAVDHGIEPPGEREKSGKNRTGRINVSAVKSEDGLKIVVSDDGKGLDIDKIREIAVFKGLLDPGTQNFDLLSILTHPGISTRDNPDTISGRGIGLDLVYQKIKQLDNGELDIKTEPGAGTSISLSIPGGFTLSTYQLIRCGSNVIAVPEKSIESVVRTEHGNYDSNGEGFLFFNGNPVFTLDGRSMVTDRNPGEGFGVILKHLDREGVFLADEILFKKDIPDDRLTLIIEENQYLYKIAINKKHADFLYLNPAIVSMAY